MQSLSIHTRRVAAGFLQSLSTMLLAMTLALSGRFHIIWNGEPRFMLIDDQGRWTEILLDKALAKSYGGAAALNGKRVKIVGEEASVPGGSVRVLSIELD